MTESSRAQRNGNGRHSSEMPSDHFRAGTKKPVLITGGAGFIGTNLADRLLSGGQRVTILDNLSRVGVERNLNRLSNKHGDLLEVQIGDVRNKDIVDRVVRRAARVFHLAAQVAVTTSLADPINDFEVNARGTINVLEAIRASSVPPPLVFTSTNKVYGALDDVAIERVGSHYRPVEKAIRRLGIGDSRHIEFLSPYGCSKGCADQYVLDYARTFQLPTVVFRMSCIYGPHQCGNEDQGWIAHFLLSALAGEPITLYGDGMQVRDVLFVEDLVNAFQLAMENINAISGTAFNIGGGPANAVSLLEVIDEINNICEETVQVSFSKWRAADQRYYVSDTSKFRTATGWEQRISAAEGTRRLHEWFTDERGESLDALRLNTSTQRLSRTVEIAGATS